ncbi:MAG: hypothetical protein V1716_00975 [Candidatus Uhrbacteria bacterium]
MSTHGVLADRSYYKQGVVMATIVEGRFETIGMGDYFIPILDANLPEKYKATGVKYRRLATKHGVSATHPVCYRVRVGFTLMSHAPQVGPCYKKFQYLQDWNFPDEATEDGYVFWGLFPNNLFN